MKELLIKTIEAYQLFFSFVLKNLLGINSSCRFSTTCSTYSKQAIQKNGFIKGGYLSAVRLLKCQPFYNGN